MQDRFLTGRPIAYMIYVYFRVTGAHEALLDCKDLFSIALHGDDIQEIDTRWDHVLLSTSEVPNDIFWTVCRVCKTPNCIGYVRTRNQSKSIEGRVIKS